jgi:hypothetical protein
MKIGITIGSQYDLAVKITMVLTATLPVVPMVIGIFTTGLLGH